MDVYEALYTTRAMRRVKLDPIPLEVQRKILDAAIRAPSGGNQQNWRFLLVDSPEVKAEIAPLYQKCLGNLWTTFYAPMVAAAAADPDNPDSKQFVRVRNSAQYLADHFEDYPLMLFAFSKGDTSGSSIFPAIWNAQLAARAEGVGSALTSVLQFEKEATLAALGVPPDENWVMNCCVTFGYPTGRWGVAARRPVHEVSFHNKWGEPLPFAIPEPLWP
jgi:nitroreductase